MSDDLLERARLLRDLQRFDDAIAMLHGHLATEPESFSAFYELAVTRLLGDVDRGQGLLDIKQAIAIAPEVAAAHSIQSALLHASGRYQDALLAAGKAKGLDPEMAYAWFCEGNALLGLRALPGAESSARKALELDPDHPSAPNLLSTVLYMQHRFDEAEAVTDRHLERNPENPWTFATAGWTALRQGQRVKAERIFLEALRLQPGLEKARVGLREAYKARSPTYRLYLLHMSYLQRQVEGYRVIMALGMGVVFAAVAATLVTVHPLPAVMFIVSFLWVFGAWIGSSFGHLLVLRDPTARLSLNRREVMDGLAAGILVAGGALIMLLGAGLGSSGVAAFGAMSMGASVPASFAFIHPSAKGRMVFGLMALVVIACGMVVLVLGPDAQAASAALVVAGLVVLMTPSIAANRALQRKMSR